MDYKADYILMVAELYQAEGNIVLARSRLSFLGEKTALEVVSTALIFAEQYQYDPIDLQLIQDLKDALEISSP
jgi:hypothetical protein